MTVTTMRRSATSRPRLHCAWVPVQGRDGRTRMEMRWFDVAGRPVTRQAA